MCKKICYILCLVIITTTLFLGAWLYYRFRYAFTFEEKFQIHGHNRIFYVNVPDDFGDSEEYKFPVIIMIHGFSSNAH